MKEMICLLLLLSLLSGCISKVPSNGGTSFGDPEINVQRLPEKVDNLVNLPVLKWVCLTDFGAGGGNRVWSGACRPAVESNACAERYALPRAICDADT